MTLKDVERVLYFESYVVTEPGLTPLEPKQMLSEEEYMDGYYFIKDGKKIGGYFSQDNIFYAFFNTKEIPNNIKELFERKNFDSTSYIDLSLNDFYTAINNRFNKNLTITIDSN
mgnify:CR=1 FL=1